MAPLATYPPQAASPVNDAGVGAGNETIVDWLSLRASQNPGRAVFFQRTDPDSAQWQGATFEQMLERVNRYASALAALGLNKGDVVAITLPTSLDWECADKAVLTLGGVVVGIEPHAPVAYQRHIVTTVRPRALLVETPEQIRSYPPELLKDVKFAISMRPSRAQIVDGDVSGETNVDGLTVHPWSVLRQFGAAPTAFEEPGPDDPAAIVFSSGTTGGAKGVEFSHRQLLIAVRSIVERIGTLEKEDRTICWLPMGNLFQRMINLCAIEYGMEIYYHDNPLTIMESLKSVHPTVIIGVPKVYQRIYRGFREHLARLPLGMGRRLLASLDAPASHDGARAPGHRLVAWLAGKLLLAALGGRMSFMVSGSAPCPVEILRFFHRLGIPLLEAYGVSENAVPIALNARGDGRIGSVGRPLSANEVCISEAGEVLVRGAGVCEAYLNAPGRVLNRDAEGYYHTGDEGHIDADGYLWLSGRQSDVVKLSNGRRVNLTDVERHLWTLDLVEQAVAFGHGRDYVTCALVLSPPTGAMTTPTQQMATILKTLHQAQADWAAYSRVRGVLVVAEPFSMEKEELTVNLKLRRSTIEAHHARALAELDDRIRSGPPASDNPIAWIHA